MKKILMLLVALLSVSALAACNLVGTTTKSAATTTADAGTTKAADTTTEAADGDTTTAEDVTTDVPVTEPQGTSDWSEEDLEDYKAYIEADLDEVISSLGNMNQFTEEVQKAINDAYEDGEDAIENANTVADIKAAYEDAYAAIADCIPYANGIYDFTGLSNAERTNIIGVIEQYAMKTGLTGLTLYESGSYVMYNERITLGTETYIPSYGFGTLSEGAITAPLASESNDAWKMYYHSYESSDPGTANYWNDQGEQVADFFDYFGGSLYTTFMADTKDAYEWVPYLANETRPVALNASADGTATRFRVSIKTSSIKYNTLSTIASRAAYNGRAVDKEDYLTSYKILLTQSNGQYRGSEAAESSSVRIVGIDKYYDATEKCEGLWDETAWNTYVADNLKVYTEDGVDYFEWEFNQAVTPFYAMYYITSSLFTPIPMSFVELVGLDNIFGFNSDKTETPVDNSLSLGAYTLESWESDKVITYKKNPYYVYADTKYSIQGVVLTILAGISTDEDLAVKEFLAGNLDAASLTQNYLTQYKNDPRTRRATGGSNFKINVNSCDAETWEYYFGEDGVVAQTAKEDYWEVEPALSNAHFLQALNYAIDRQTVADAHGSVPSCSYLGSAYMSDPENGVSYNMTDVHKNAIAYLTNDTDGYGYSLQLARDYFKMALMELEADGVYQPGTKENPTVITLECAWMYAYMETSYHAELKSMLETAFNDESVTGGLYKLEVTFWVGDVWSDVYYKKLMLGQFDLGFGSISGNSYNILDYLTVLSADQTMSGGFTLNWGPATNDPDAAILVYNGMRWSFDGLLSAANGTAIIVDGAKSDTYEVSDASVEKNEDGSQTVTIQINNFYPVYNTIDFDVVVYGYSQSDYSDYAEWSVVYDEEGEMQSNAKVEVSEDGKTIIITVVIAKDDVDACTACANCGIDLYFGNTLVDEESGDAIVENELDYLTTIDFAE